MSEERTVETNKETKLAPVVKFPSKKHPLKMTAKTATKTIEGAPTKAEPAFVEAGAPTAPIHEEAIIEAPTAPNMDVLIGEVITEEGTTRQAVRVGDWNLTRWNGAEPAIRDTDLAERLGFAQPRDVRKIINRLIEESELTDVYCRATVARQSTGNGASREYEVNEYWLTEEQAYFVVTQSKTKKARSLTKMMISVFMAARRGTLQPVNATVDMETVKALLRAVLDQRESQAKAMALLEHVSEFSYEFWKRTAFDLMLVKRELGDMRGKPIDLEYEVVPTPPQSASTPAPAPIPAPAPVPAPVPQPKPVSAPAPLTLTAPTPPLPRQGKGVRWVEDLASELGCRVDQAWMMAKAVGRKFHESYRAHRPGVGLRWRFCSELVERIRDYHARYGVPAEAKN